MRRDRGFRRRVAPTPIPPELTPPCTRAGRPRRRSFGFGLATYAIAASFDKLYGAAGSRTIAAAGALFACTVVSLGGIGVGATRLRTLKRSVASHGQAGSACASSSMTTRKYSYLDTRRMEGQTGTFYVEACYFKRQGSSLRRRLDGGEVGNPREVSRCIHDRVEEPTRLEDLHRCLRGHWIPCSLGLR